jgi:alcohol dehydrogenase
MPAQPVCAPTRAERPLRRQKPARSPHRMEARRSLVGIYFADVSLPLLQLYLRGVHFHNGKGHARPNMTPTLDAAAAGVLHPELVTSGIYQWDELPEVLTSTRAGHKPVFVLNR